MRFLMVRPSPGFLGSASPGISAGYEEEHTSMLEHIFRSRAGARNRAGHAEEETLEARVTNDQSPKTSSPKQETQQQQVPEENPSPPTSTPYPQPHINPRDISHPKSQQN